MVVAVWVCVAEGSDRWLTAFSSNCSYPVQFTHRFTISSCWVYLPALVQLFPQVYTSSMLWLLSTSWTDCSPYRQLCSVTSYWTIKKMYPVVQFAEIFCSGVLIYTHLCFSPCTFSLHLHCGAPETRVELRVAAISHVFVHTHSQRPQWI